MVHDLPDALFALPGEGAGNGIVVALSGGLDSSVLLHRLAALAPVRGRGLRALHVHHGLHPDADAWVLHCSALCDALDVPLSVCRVAVDRGGGMGLEAAARSARHAAFAGALGEDEVLALAHHRDDQAETFLLRALRASGPEGLAAMRPWRRFARGWMWRPLLAQPRARLEAWARAREMQWIEDPANADPAHDRSFLRTRLLPLMRERWPMADAALARSATLCAEAADLLAAEDALTLDAMLSPAAADDGAGGRRLAIAPLRALPPAHRARMLRAWIRRLGLAPLPASGVDAIVRLLDARADGTPGYRWADACVRAWRGHLYALPLQALVPLPPDWSRTWDGRAPLDLPGGGRLALEGAGSFERPLRAHARRGGERMRLPGRVHTHALKHLLQDAGVPPWQRGRMPLLSCAEGTLLAAGDRLLAAPLQDWLQAQGARLCWRDLA
jgi:tRNA(Ile)-lysidine synthase